MVNSRLGVIAGVSVGLLTWSLAAVTTPASATTAVDTYDGPFSVSVTTESRLVTGPTVVYDDSNATMSTSGSTVWANLEGGTRGQDAELEFDPPSGQRRFAVGTYAPASSDPDPDQGYMAYTLMSTSYDVFGSFDVRRIHYTGRVIDAIDLTYTFRIGGDRNNVQTFGELTFGYPSGPVEIEPSTVTFPNTTYLHQESQPVTLWVHRLVPQHVRIHKVSVVGPDRDEFELAASGGLVRTLSGVLAWVTFEPTRVGRAHAWLRVEIGDHGVISYRRVPLESVAQAGTTSWDMTSEPGDEIGNGGTFHLTDRYLLDVAGSAEAITARYGSDFAAWIEPATGRRLKVGTYRHITPSPAVDHPGFVVQGNGIDCGTVSGQFTIRDIRYRAGGALKRLDLTFVQYCDGSAAGLHGHLRFHATS